MSSRSCEHAETECTECFKERIRGIQIGASATPSRFVARDRSNPRPKDREPSNRWERGEAVDHTRNMPYLDKNGNKVPIKRFVEGERHNYRKNETIAVD